MATALKDKLEQAKEATSLSILPSVLSIFQDDGLKRQLGVGIPEGSGLTVSRLLLVAFNEIRRNPELGSCTRDSFVGALLQAARLGLEIGGPLGHFHLVPFKNHRLGVKEVTPILGYRGMVVLARRSGEIASIGARPVFAADHFDFSYGLEDRLVHRPALVRPDKDPIVAFYGVARFVNGGVQPLVMSKSEVDSFRKRSRAAQAGSGPWETDYEAMGSKTVIRRMSPFLPLTVEAANAIAEDEEREEGRTPEMANLDLSDFGITDGAGEGGAGKARAKPANNPPSSASTVVGKSEPAVSEEERAEQPPDAGGAEAAGASAGNPAAVATTPAPPPARCEICGAEEDADGHLKHDDAKHAEEAKKKREAKKQTDGGLFEKPEGTA